MFLSEDRARVAVAGDRWEAVELETFAGPAAPDDRQEGRRAFHGYDGDTGDAEAFIPFYEKKLEKKRQCSARRPEEDILREAREKAAAIEQEAYTKGFEQGQKDGFDDGRQRADTLVERIEALLLEMGALKRTLIARGEKELLDIVFAIARKVVRTQTEIDTEAVRNAILEAMGHAAEQGRLVVWIHPEDERLVESLRSDFHQRFAQPSGVRIQTDPSLHRGGCRVETIHGRIDATVETQMGKIREALEAVYRLEAGA
jgi:flagellar assembly protein FliH